MSEFSKDDQTLFEALLLETNYLGALMLIKKIEQNHIEHTIFTTRIMNQIVRNIELSRKNREFESVEYLRATLLYMMRSYPGLSVFYRELIKKRSHDMLNSLKGIYDGLGDIANGKIDGLQTLKEMTESLGNTVKESPSVISAQDDIMSNFIKSAELSLSSGLDRARKAVQEIFLETDSAQSTKISIQKESDD